MRTQTRRRMALHALPTGGVTVRTLLLLTACAVCFWATGSRVAGAGGAGPPAYLATDPWPAGTLSVGEAARTNDHRLIRRVNRPGGYRVPCRYWSGH
jgi:hypothetical protein